MVISGRMFCSWRIEMMEPVKKRIPDVDTGIQNDLPTPTCLMVFRVLRLSAVKIAAIDATANSRMDINVYSA
jgi:hypothetical protein